AAAAALSSDVTSATRSAPASGPELLPVGSTRPRECLAGGARAGRSSWSLFALPLAREDFGHAPSTAERSGGRGAPRGDAGPIPARRGCARARERDTVAGVGDEAPRGGPSRQASKLLARANTPRVAGEPAGRVEAVTLVRSAATSAVSSR